MTSKDCFDSAILRATHLIELYDLLHDTRQRNIRNDWAKKFKTLMHWNQKEDIVRVDGKNGRSVLILHDSLGINRAKFAHEYTSELLRSSVVSAISAMDRYFHDIIVELSTDILQKKEKDISIEMKNIELPILTFKNAIQKIKKDNNSRPGTIIKTAIQEKLHRGFTFQKPDDIVKAMKIIGIKEFWPKVATELGSGIKVEEILKTIRKITLRRNQIVHEADLIRKTKIKNLTLRAISRNDTIKWIKWITSFIESTDKVIKKNI